MSFIIISQAPEGCSQRSISIVMHELENHRPAALARYLQRQHLPEQRHECNRVSLGLLSNT
jgi:hypothetical protein